jgi:hypothetical protein
MSIKEVIKKESFELKNWKRPFESVAFIVLSVLIFQQLVYLIINIINFKKSGWFSTANFATSNLQGFVSRIVGIDSSKVLFMIFGILAWLFYYFALYMLVFRYAEKHNLAKWVWTLFVAFGPTLIFIPPYIFFIVYAYRIYFVRFFKRIKQEFNEFDYNKPLEEDSEITNTDIKKSKKESEETTVENHEVEKSDN